MNSLNLIGRVAHDVEVKYVGEKEMPVVNNSIAVTDKGNREKVNFIPFTILGKGAENLKKVAEKGDMIALENAELKVENYTNKNDEKRTRTYALAFFFSLVKKKSKGKEEQKESNEKFESPLDFEDDDMPF
ncbi:hypothetical protein GCM10022378_01990 [Salinicoccus jeotgali]|uniref:Single-stranded DNA-binding protein n=1 Tax=Salinicoccus jeotgali TaxID=381634 RepID=A0ABP7EC04_9STAP